MPINLNCPRCSSEDTMRSPGLAAVSVFSFISGSCLLWIPIIGWIMAPIMFGIAIWTLIAVRMKKKKNEIAMYCKRCHKSWTVKEDSP